MHPEQYTDVRKIYMYNDRLIQYARVEASERIIGSDIARSKESIVYKSKHNRIRTQIVEIRPFPENRDRTRCADASLVNLSLHRLDPRNTEISWPYIAFAGLQPHTERPR